MKAVQYAAISLLVVLQISSYTSQAQQKVVDKQENVKNDGFGVLVIEVWGADKGAPGISYNNQNGQTGKMLLQHTDAIDADVAVINYEKKKYAIVAYFSPKDSSYYAEFFEWDGFRLASLGLPVALLNNVSYNASLNVRTNVNGEFIFELEDGSTTTNPRVEGWIDPVTGQPTLRTIPKVNYRITENYE